MLSREKKKLVTSLLVFNVSINIYFHFYFNITRDQVIDERCIAMKIILDLPFGFPINNIISLLLCV